jgi:hypothetical protein
MRVRSEHRGWSICLVVGCLLLLALIIVSGQWREKQAALIEAQSVTNATLRTQLADITADIANDAAARDALSEATYDAVVTPPSRAKLIALLRQWGRAAGLKDFKLELGPATAPTDLQGTSLVISPIEMAMAAADDRVIYGFLDKVLRYHQGALKLERLSLQRDPKPLTEARADLVRAEMRLSWLSYDDNTQDVP